MTTTGKPMSAEAIAQRRERVAQLTRDGRSAREISAIVGMTMRSVVRVRSELGLARKWVGPMTADERRRAVELLDDGCSYAEVARTLGRSESAIARHWPGHGWTQPEIGQMAALARYARARALMERISA